MTRIGTLIESEIARRGSSRRGGCACRLLGVRLPLLPRVDGVEGVCFRAAPALSNCLFL